MTADELAAITGATLLPPAHIHEGDSVLKIRAPRVPRHQRECLGIELRDDVRRAAAALVPEHPLEVMSDRQTARLPRAIDDFQARYLERIFERHELQEVRTDAVRGMFEPAVPKTVADDVRLSRFANRQRRRAP